jgi:hypothetical protein
VKFTKYCGMLIFVLSPDTCVIAEFYFTNYYNQNKSTEYYLLQKGN